MHRRLLLVILVLSLTGCQTLEKALKATEQAAAIMDTGSVQKVIAVARSDDPQAAARTALKQRVQQYSDHPELIFRDIDHLKRDYQRIRSILAGKVSRHWGKSETRLPSKRTYVKYTQNYDSRAIVDFDKGTILVETVSDGDYKRGLKQAIITTLLTPDDPRAVDLFSDKSIRLDSKRPPYLKGLVLDHQQREIADPGAASAYADHLIANQLGQRKLKQGKGRVAHFVKWNMVANFSHKQAVRYRPLVDRFSSKYQVSRSLVYAMIHTESNFNPFAVSPVPAYGLMQLVPASGGRDAYLHARKQDAVPSKRFLFDPSNNIELGTAYLDVLYSKYLAGVNDRISREYCVIAAYNTGSGNVFKAFGKGRNQALQTINGMKPADVYTRLRADLPYAETRAYLRKVVDRRRLYASLK